MAVFLIDKLSIGLQIRESPVRIRVVPPAKKLHERCSRSFFRLKSLGFLNEEDALRYAPRGSRSEPGDARFARSIFPDVQKVNCTEGAREAALGRAAGKNDPICSRLRARILRSFTLKRKTGDERVTPFPPSP